MLSMDVITIPENDNESSCKKIKPCKDLLTREDVEIVVKRALGTKTEVIDYRIKNYSEDKLGFLGSYRLLIATVLKSDSSEKKIHSFFLKSIPYEIQQQAQAIEDCKAFYKETCFYRYIAPYLLHGIKDKSWMAQCYLVKDDMLVFEDLKSRNYALNDKLLNMPALKSALSSLAKLHGSSILAEKRLGKSWIELYPEVFKEYLFSRNSSFCRWIYTGIDVLVGIAKNIGVDNSCIPLIVNRIFDMIVTSKTRRNVVSHGDTKSYNLMFDNSLPLPKCVLVDFQLVRYVPMMTDVLQMIYLTTRREFRDKNEEELLRQYHEVLCETLRENDKEMELPTFKEILKEYEDMRLIGLVTTALYSPVNLLDDRDCADMTKDSEGFENTLFGERVELTLKCMKKDTLFRDMMTELVHEMIQRSKQLLAP